MTPIQNKLLEMLDWLDKFIRKHNLRYYVVGGTLIGAARHGGFIPWDDDIDIAMPRNDYEVLCNLLKNKTDHYIVETPSSSADDFLYTFAKFYDTSTTMTEHCKNNITRGVYIDIFPLDGIGNSKVEALQNYKIIDRYNMLLISRICAYRKDRKWYKNLVALSAKLIPNCFMDEKKLVLKIDNLNKRFSFDECDFVSVLMSTYRGKDIHSKELFGTPTELSFENIHVLAPEHYDKVLTEVYGNWREMPPEDKRKSAHDYIGIDLFKPYME